MNKDKVYPYYEFNNNGNRTHYETSKGYWCKYEYDKNNNVIHYGDAYGRINIGSWINGIRIMINE